MASTSILSPANILIVDDEIDNLSVLSDTLNQKGYKVRKALSGSLALSSINFSAPDLILLDINMPEMDGFEVCQSLKSNPVTSNIPIIFLSIFDTSHDIVQGFNLGGDDYITKPFRTEEVLARVERQITIQKLRRELTRQNIELKSRNEMLTLLNRELEHATQAKDEFLSMASHELRTPLTNMKMAMKMLGFAQTPELSKKYLDIMQVELHRELNLVSDLLDLQRVGNSQESTESAKISLQSELPSLAEPFMDRACEAGQTLSVSVPTTLDPISLPPEDLKRIISELLNNACKYTPSGGDIKLSARDIPRHQAEDDPDDRSLNIGGILVTEISLSNTSPEIPPAELDQFFDPFYQSPSSHSTTFRSSGLGLSLVKRMVERIYGEIEALYEDGSIRFSLVFPKSE